MSDKTFNRVITGTIVAFIAIIILIILLNWSKCSIKVRQNLQNYADVKVDGSKYQYSCISETDNPETGEHIVEIHFITKE